MSDPAINHAPADANTSSEVSKKSQLSIQPLAGASSDTTPLRPRDCSSSTTSAYSAGSLRKVQVPKRMRSRFLHDTAQLPPDLLQHLEQYIPLLASSPPSFISPPTRSSRRSSSSSRSLSPSSPSSDSSANTGKMDMGPDLIDLAGDTDVEPENPQVEASSAATERANLAHCNGHIDPDQAPSPQTPTTTLNEWYEDAAETGDPDFKNADRTWKSWTTTALTRRHNVVYSSAYTRPAEEILREVLETRYPAGGEAGMSARQRGWCCNVVDRLRAVFWRNSRTSE